MNDLDLDQTHVQQHARHAKMNVHDETAFDQPKWLTTHAKPICASEPGNRHMHSITTPDA
jgi:hypothetical protein